MKRIITKIVIALPVLLFVYSTMRIIFYDFPVYTPRPASTKRSDGTYHYKGAIHIHTNFSHDGTGTIPQLLLAASKAELNFVITTDHNNLDAKEYEGYKQGILLIAATEVSTPAGHFLAFDIDEPLRESEKSDYYFKRVREKGGFSIIAHPTSPTNPWTDKKNLDFEGIELINMKTYLENSFRPPFLRGLISTMYTPLNFKWGMMNLLTYPEKEVELLFDTLAIHPVTIICGIDAHGRPSYDRVIDSCINHIITDTPLKNSPESDRKIIISAIRNGSAYLAYDFIASADNFYIYAGQSSTSSLRTIKAEVKDFEKRDMLRFRVYSKKRMISEQKGESITLKIPSFESVLVQVFIEVPSIFFGNTELLWITALVL
jgi:hypothetical protein